MHNFSFFFYIDKVYYFKIFTQWIISIGLVLSKQINLSLIHFHFVLHLNKFRHECFCFSEDFKFDKWKKIDHDYNISFIDSVNKIYILKELNKFRFKFIDSLSYLRLQKKLESGLLIRELFSFNHQWYFFLFLFWTRIEF